MAQICRLPDHRVGWAASDDVPLARSFAGSQDYIDYSSNTSMVLYFGVLARNGTYDILG